MSASAEVPGRKAAGDEGAAVARIGARSIPIGAPLSFDAEYAGITALDLLLGALGGDLVSGLQQAARRRRIALDQVEALVEVELDNPLTHLGVRGEIGHPGLVRLAAKVFVESAAAEAQIDTLWEETLARSPLVHTFRRCLELKLELVVT